MAMTRAEISKKSREGKKNLGFLLDPKKFELLSAKIDADGLTKKQFMECVIAQFIYGDFTLN